jgi:hypothetical protein
VLLAGEAASFSGELQVSGAVDDSGEAQNVSFVVGMIGPEVPPPPGVPETPIPTAATTETPAATTATAETPAPPAETTAGTPATAGQGTITVQVYSCPPGMTAATVAAAACAPTVEDFDIIISGATLQTPLTLADATASGSSFTWSGLPDGDYLIAEAVLPAGATTYILSARDTRGDPDTGYLVTLDEATRELGVRIYNFSP